MQTLKLTVLFAAVGLLVCSYKPVRKGPVMKWLSLQQVEENVAKEKRPILIDLYTDWCGWCGVMDKKTYGNKKVADYLAANFYAVKIDAESPKPITWQNKVYRYNPSYKTHEFAIYLAAGNLSYPTTIIIPPDGSGPQAIPGYMTPKQFEVILKYFGEGQYLKIPFDQYHKSFKSSW